MDIHPQLTTFVYIALVVFASLVIAYWITYTRRLKTSSRLGKSEGISMATEERERRHNPKPAA